MDMKVHVNENDIKKDADGFEDIDAFWESTEPGKCNIKRIQVIESMISL